MPTGSRKRASERTMLTVRIQNTERSVCCRSSTPPGREPSSVAMPRPLPALAGERLAEPLPAHHGEEGLTFERGDVVETGEPRFRSLDPPPEPVVRARLPAVQ